MILVICQSAVVIDGSGIDLYKVENLSEHSSLAETGQNGTHLG
jgi:hypothetical protein